MSNNEHVAALLGSGIFALGHDLGVPPVTDILNQTIETLADLLRAPATPCQSSLVPSRGTIQGKAGKGEKGGIVLSTGAPVPPDVPGLAETLLLADAADLGARDALVVAVVPLADVLGDLDVSAAGLRVRGRVHLAVGLPWQGTIEAEVQELKGALGTLAR